LYIQVLKNKNYQYEKIILEIKNNKTKNFLLDTLVKTYKILPPVFVIGGFIQAWIYSTHLNISLLFYSLEDYWNFGVSAFASLLPILIFSILGVPTGVIIFKQRHVNHEKIKINTTPTKSGYIIVYLGRLLFLLLPIFFFLYANDGSSKSNNITSFIVTYVIIIYRIFPELLKQYFKYSIMIIFLITITINSYFEINYKLENNKNNLEYIITTFHEIPKNSEYILSTSNYQIFLLENKTLLIPNSDIISIVKNSKNQTFTKNKFYQFLKKIYENNF